MTRILYPMAALRWLLVAAVCSLGSAATADTPPAVASASSDLAIVGRIEQSELETLVAEGRAEARRAEHAKLAADTVFVAGGTAAFVFGMRHICMFECSGTGSLANAALFLGPAATVGGFHGALASASRLHLLNGLDRDQVDAVRLRRRGRALTLTGVLLEVGAPALATGATLAFSARAGGVVGVVTYLSGAASMSWGIPELRVGRGHGRLTRWVPNVATSTTGAVFGMAGQF